MRCFSRSDLASIIAFVLVVGAHPAEGAPLFEEHTERLGSPQPCFDAKNPNAEGCYSSYVLATDVNRDGALDLVFANGGGYFVPATDAPLALYLGDGKGGFREVSESALGGFRGRVRQVAVGDIDGDGDGDIYAPDGYGLARDALFINDGQREPRFIDEGPTRLPEMSHAGAARFGDVNGDGSLDLVVADWGAMPPASPEKIRVYLNDGTGHFKERPDAVPKRTPSGGTGPVDVDLFDANGDFALDMLVAHRKGRTELYFGDGKGGFSLAELPPPGGSYVYGPDECDVDGDGDLDIWLDNAGPGHTTQLLINDGKGHFTDETAARVTGNPAADDNVVRCADVNGDGALDAVIGSVGGDRRVLLNDGHGRFALLSGSFPTQAISTLGAAVGDLDGDGRLDVALAQGEKGSFKNRLYFGTEAVARDTRPPVIRALERRPKETTKGDLVVRFAVVDGATSDTGPRLAKVAIETGGHSVMATFVGGDLFRTSFHPGSHRIEYRACATDVAGNTGCSDLVSAVPESGGCARLGCAVPPYVSDEGGVGPWLMFSIVAVLRRRGSVTATSRCVGSTRARRSK